MEKSIFKKLVLQNDLEALLQNKEIILVESREDIFDLAMGRSDKNIFEVAYETPGKGNVVEATVVRCKNGISINYTEPYMRRRDPDSMVIADDKPTDKPRFIDRFGYDFKDLRTQTFQWLQDQEELILLPFWAGGKEYGYEALLIAPSNAGFFVGALADIQGFIPKSKIPSNYKPRAVIYLAPPFRHTHFDGKQVVVHNRADDKTHELFCYNLYPGPSAKKGVYSVLLDIGEEEGWTTLHASAVKITTPYENTFIIMHEGASGGGKSEMTEQFHREPDGRLLIGTNLKTKEKFYLDIKEACELQPVTDDMALAIPSLQNGKKLVIKDAENGWFLRIDHINEYGTAPDIEKLTIYPPEPLIFLNIDGKPEATCLIWEHTLDAPGKPCPNPRTILPRRFIQGIVNEPVEVDIRSFGVRTPPSSKEHPNYGIIGLFHILPPALAWLWRLVAPRGHANPSITSTDGMSSEGVGSYWPFATGRMVDQANILLKQIIETPATKYILIPNQHIGVYKVGFMGQWIAREYLSRRGNFNFKKEPLVPSRSPLLGYALESLKLDGQSIPKDFLQVDLQKENGPEGYDAGAAILTSFFKKELQKFLVPDLDPLGKQIIETCLRDGSLQEYVDLIK